VIRAESSTAASSSDISLRLVPSTVTDFSEPVVIGQVTPNASGIRQIAVGAALVCTLWMKSVASQPVPQEVTFGAGVSGRPAWLVERVGEGSYLSGSGVGLSRPWPGGDVSATLEVPGGTSEVEAVRWIKAATGFSWQRIAEMLQVSRQAVDKWMKGGPINDVNRRHLLAVRDVLERAAVRHSPPENLAVWLDTPRGAAGRTPADLLAAGEIDRVRLLAVTTPSPGVKAPAQWVLRRGSIPFPEGEARMEPARPESADEPMPA
jgi:hypothetical protein